MVKSIDDALGQILDALERLDLRENTIVVFTSDPGDFAGEHGMVLKSGVFYDCLTKVTLIFSAPGLISQGGKEASMANLVDIVPTVFEFQGIEIPDSMEGQPLPSATDAKPREYTFSEYGRGGPAFTFDDPDKFLAPYGSNALLNTLKEREAEGLRKMVCSKAGKYVHDPMGDLDELYYLESDPWELQNLAGKPDYSDKEAELRAVLSAWSDEVPE